VLLCRHPAPRPRRHPGGPASRGGARLRAPQRVREGPGLCRHRDACPAHV